MSAWIEIESKKRLPVATLGVALFVSAWIEIVKKADHAVKVTVALFVSAWIEIKSFFKKLRTLFSRTLCECVD